MLINKTNAPIKTTLFRYLGISYKVFTLALLTVLLVACGGSSGSSDNSENSSGFDTASLEMSAEPTSLESGQTATITWEAQNSVSCSAEDGWTSETQPVGTTTVGPLNETTVYTMSCVGEKGGPISESITLNVISSQDDPKLTPSAPTPEPQVPVPHVPIPMTPPAPKAPAPEVPEPKAPAPEVPEPKTPAPEAPAPAPAPTLNLSADATMVDENGSTTLRWTSTNTVSCSSIGGWTNNTTTTGMQLIANIINTTSYRMTCTGNGGTVSKSVTITVNIAPPAPAPTLSISANPNSVTEGENAVISWSSENTDSCSAVGGWTNKTTTSGTDQLGPLSNTQKFRITCTGAGGGISKSVLVTVEPAASDGTAEISWTPPTTNADGSTITDLTGYTIHYGMSPKNYTKQIEITNPGITSYTVDNLAPATYYFALKAKDSTGNSSAFSNELSKSIQ